MSDRLLAITPIDGRYKKSVSELNDIFSEYGMIRRRVDVEIEYFIFLSTFIPELSGVNTEHVTKLREISKNFNLEEAKVVKEIEERTRHDVKAVEYYKSVNIFHLFILV